MENRYYLRFFLWNNELDDLVATLQSRVEDDALSEVKRLQAGGRGADEWADWLLANAEAVPSSSSPSSSIPSLPDVIPAAPET